MAQKMAKIVSKDIAAVDYSGKPSLWRIVFDDGKETYHAHLSPESVRYHEILYQLQESGVNIALVEELLAIEYQRGKESEWER